MIYNHKALNDLAWCLNSPFLVDTGEISKAILCLDQQWGKTQLDHHVQLLQSVDRAPSSIQQFLSQRTQFRLGYYFEDLLAYFFINSPNYDLKARNVIVQSSQRTLGEMDFIVSDKNNQSTLHLEVAVKFYLELKSDDQSFYFGPNIRDRLDIKLERLLEHQCLLSQKPETINTLRELKLSIDQQALLLRGRLFTHDRLLRGQNNWIRVAEFLALQREESQWILLTKPDWLAELYHIESAFLPTQLLSKSSFNELITEQIKMVEVGKIYIIAFAEVQNGKELRRGFIVNNEWEQQALQTLL